jgi:hypothetical protein
MRLDFHLLQLQKVTTVLYNLERAEAVSHWFPSAAARVSAWFRSCGICGGQSVTMAGFIRVLPFPLSIRIPPIAPQSSSSVI